MVNVMVRSSRALFEISTGLLIEGCPDAADRSAAGEGREGETEAEAASRRRRSLDCEAICGEGHYGELCKYDCVSADISGAAAEVS